MMKGANTDTVVTKPSYLTFYYYRSAHEWFFIESVLGKLII